MKPFVVVRGRKQISDKSLACPNCGLPSDYNDDSAVSATQSVSAPVVPDETLAPHENGTIDFDLQEFRNALISFRRDYAGVFTPYRYVDTNSAQILRKQYGRFYEPLRNELTQQYVRTNSSAWQIDDDELEHFVAKMEHLTRDINEHNSAYVTRTVAELEDYFDHIMDHVDPGIKLDSEQRRAVVTDDNYCHVVDLSI